MESGAEKSFAGLPAFQCYCANTHTTMELQPSDESFRMGDVFHSNLDKGVIRIPYRNERLFHRVLDRCCTRRHHDLLSSRDDEATAVVR